MSANRIIVTLVLVSIVVGIFSSHAPMQIAIVKVSKGVLLPALFGWALVFFGAEIAPLLNIHNPFESNDFIDPIIRMIGWVFVLGALGLLIWLYQP
jgi:hypothetical protein